MFQFFGKERLVENLVFDYLEAFKQAQDNFYHALQSCLLNGVLCENFDFYIKQTHKFESKADDIRDEINDLMYSKALIPESRGDIMALVEGFDRIPDLFEHTLYTIKTQKLILPEFLIADVQTLLDVSLKCCDLLVNQTTALFKKQEGIRGFLKQIDTLESQCDHYQISIRTKLFKSDVDPFDKLQIKELVLELGRISDRCDTVSKQVNIISMKRRV